jgi:hypothetical protein
MIGADACSPALARNVRRRLVKSRCQLEAENLFLRHQLSVTLRRTPALCDRRYSGSAHSRGCLYSWSRAARDWIFCASVRLRENAYTSQKLGLNFCLTLTLRLMGGNHALHYESICLGLPVGTPARVCLENPVPEGQPGFSPRVGAVPVQFIRLPRQRGRAPTTEFRDRALSLS